MLGVLICISMCINAAEWSVSTLMELTNKFNYESSSVMANGDNVVMAVGEYKASAYHPGGTSNARFTYDAVFFR